MIKPIHHVEPCLECSHRETVAIRQRSKYLARKPERLSGCCGPLILPISTVPTYSGAGGRKLLPAKGRQDVFPCPESRLGRVLLAKVPSCAGHNQKHKLKQGVIMSAIPGAVHCASYTT